MSVRTRVAAIVAAVPLIAGVAPATAQTDKAPAGTIHGVGSWVFVNHKTTDRIADLARPLYVNWISAYDYMEHVHTGPNRFNWAGFDAAQKAAHELNKPWSIMVIPSTLERGLPSWYMSDLASNEKISIYRGNFPAWYSKTANAKLSQLRAAIANRYGDDPLLQMVRVNLFWATHGEPWFEGGGQGRKQWLDKYRSYTKKPNTTYEQLRAAYNQAEISAFDEMARLFPSRIKLSMATGFAYSDYVTATNASIWGKPNAHPQRLNTWGKLRGKYGDRVVFQQNGAGSPENNGNYDGARGFGLWLANSFGRNGVYPGAIGAQQVAGVIKYDGRMDVNRFRKMMSVEAGRSTFIEIYETDVAAANAAANATGRALRDALSDADRLNWR